MKKIAVIIMVMLFLCDCSNKMRIDTEVSYFYDNSGRRIKLRNGEKFTGDVIINRYDKFGNVTKIILTDQDGFIAGEQDFDESGHLTQTQTYKDSKLIGFTTFDSTGKKSSDNYVDGDTKQTTTFNYEYDGDKQVGLTKSLDGETVYSQRKTFHNDKLVGVQVENAEGMRHYDYDEKFIKETMTDTQGNLIYQYENDSEKNSQKYTHFKNGKIDNVIQCSLAENVVRQESYKNDKIISATESDFDGNKLKDEEYKNGKLAGYVEYIRQDGKLIGRKLYSADNKVKRYYKYINKNGVTQVVTYDGNDNLIEFEE